MSERIVYVIQEIPGTKEGNPRINIMGASKYGQFKFLLPESSQIIFSPGPLVFKLRSLLKNFNEQEFTFYTNLNSKKSEDLKQNPNASMCFYWKSLKRQIRISGTVTKVSDEIADEYYSSRSYGSKIGAWASNQSTVLNNRKELFKSIEKFQKKFSDKNNITRPNYWSGWNLKPLEIEFWLQVDDRLHERLKYKKKNEIWNKFLLNP